MRFTRLIVVACTTITSIIIIVTIIRLVFRRGGVYTSQKCGYASPG